MSVDPRTQEIERLRAALHAAQVAIDDWVCLSVPEHCDPARVAAAHTRLDEYGPLFYQATVAHAIRRALAGTADCSHPAPEGNTDTPHVLSDALHWRALSALPHGMRTDLVAHCPTVGLLASALDGAPTPQHLPFSAAA